MAKNKNTDNNTSSSGGFFKTIGRWLKRMFFGGSKELAEMNVIEAERLESPAKLAVKAFFRRKIAVVALVILILLFLFVFIGPLFVPMNVNFIDVDQQNIAPGITMRAVPSGLKGQIKSISGASTFSVGVSKDNTLYMWGTTTNTLAKLDYSKFPEEIRPHGVYLAAAGVDHVTAIVIEEDDPEKGHMVFWGEKNRGQHGYNTGNADDPVLELPKEIREGRLELSKIGGLYSGKQVGCIIYDGKAYYWGNTNTCVNMRKAQIESDKTTKTIVMAAFTNYHTVMLCDDGNIIAPGEISPYHFRDEDGYSMKERKRVDMIQFLMNNKIKDVAGTKTCFAFLTEDGDIVVQGPAKYNETAITDIPSGEKAVSLYSGTFHFGALTDKGKLYLWGANDKKQCALSGASASEVFLGPYQTYTVDEGGKLIKSCGHSGYLFGTDSMGRDTLTRIIHGGKMTMTIGAVAVIISSVIAIIIGCVSGYFGGRVDMLLMRVTEIFAAIPFLPFAMMLSYVLTTRPISENTRIFIIMFILGLLSWTGLARMIRGQVLAEREKEFVLAAKAMGVKEGKIAFKHILPNVISIILVSMTLDFAGCLLTESSLSYLGFGVQQPRPTWGNMLNGANNSIVIQNYWWQWVFPALFLAMATICINIIGDTLRDALDPKSSQEK
ncbi:MAG: ABC transporter permease subunit [Clostridia bacterium]|nr:ABC transporter permease subunit [Clostridia bacterium]